MKQRGGRPRLVRGGCRAEGILLVNCNTELSINTELSLSVVWEESAEERIKFKGRRE